MNLIQRLSHTLNKHIEIFDDELKMITKLVTLVELLIRIFYRDMKSIQCRGVTLLRD